MSALLESHAVSIERGNRLILKDATAVIAAGALTAVIGPNGSGKSTLLRALAGLWRPSRGSVTLNGAALEGMSRREIARRLAFLPQDTRCDFAFTVEEIVAMGRHSHRGRFEPEHDRDRRAIESALDLCDLKHLRTRTVLRLSGGERQRVAIARCLAAEPQIVLLDEPTAHLDLQHAMTVLDLCRSLADCGRAVAVATHDVSTICRVATHAIVLNDGCIVANGSPDDVLTPQMCRDVFAVETEIATTSTGQAAFVFARRTVAPAALARERVR